mmetsp:Transcript_52931/g.106207  ORF Transcript_52931/g.106207 Transcript_52931/m.106207 type:complete len:106 (+) Transcript_52931:105-422(+)
MLLIAIVAALAVVVLVLLVPKMCQRAKQGKVKAAQPPEGAGEAKVTRNANWNRSTTDDIAQAVENGQASTEQKARLTIDFWSMPGRQESALTQSDNLSRANTETA